MPDQRKLGDHDRKDNGFSLLAYRSAALAPTFARLDACEDGKQAEVAEDVRQVLVGLRVIAESVRGPLEQA
ncbi:hypothetical protein [Streptomyces mirabilis]|uniref:hypothetical protein n=1 Tax=Streptomyces mirabilis TaxID=68239 RepID=UPI0033B4AB57